jgi:hypothetical protein
MSRLSLHTRAVLAIVEVAEFGGLENLAAFFACLEIFFFAGQHTSHGISCTNNFLRVFSSRLELSRPHKPATACIVNNFTLTLGFEMKECGN